jgi:CDP-diacylglycerol--glycerol-3-phosphate 3-phosphatidyltransferase
MNDSSVRIRVREVRTSQLLPRAALDGALWALGYVADGFIALGVTANAITVSSLMLAGIGGVLLCYGEFGWASVAMVTASLGDALDGLVARRTGSASVGGALLDASIDRYEEFLFLGGLAVYFHQSVPALALVLFALCGSFMVSYGSAKAEAQGVPVPAGAMRRAERAVALCAGVALTPVFQWATAGSSHVPAWAQEAPIFASLALIAVVANVSAIRRLQYIARSRSAVPALRPVVARNVVASNDAELDTDSGSDPQVVAAPQVVRAP